MIRDVSTHQTRGFILEPLLVLGLVAGLLLAHAIGSAQELLLVDRLVLGAGLAVVYGGVAALISGVLLLVSRAAGGRGSRVDGRFAVVIGLVPCVLFLLVSVLDVQRVRRTAEDRVASWQADGARAGSRGALLLVVAREQAGADLERRRSEGELPSLSALAHDTPSVELAVPDGATDAAVRRVITSGRAPRRPSVAGRRVYRVPGLRSPLSDDLPRGVGLVSLIELGVSAGFVEARAAEEAGDREPPARWSIVDAVGLAGGRFVVLVDPGRNEPAGAVATSARAALESSPGLVILDVVRYDAAVDTLVASLMAARRTEPALLVVTLGEPPGLLVSPAGPSRRTRPPHRASWLDVYPTALTLLGLSVPQDVRGRTLETVTAESARTAVGTARRVLKNARGSCCERRTAGSEAA